jgi:hypothetical protein
MCRFVISVLLSIIVLACSCKEVQTLAPLSVPNLDIGKEVLAELRSVFKEPDPEKPLIDRTFAGKIKPTINKWLRFYNLDIYNFRGEPIVQDAVPDPMYERDTASIYYREYSHEHNVYNPMLYDYSPNKQKYLNVRETSYVYKDDDGKYYYYGGDDCQEIYLTDRRNKTKDLVLWLGSWSFAEAAFWLDNNTYIIVGRNHYNDFSLFIHIRGKYLRDYEYKLEQEPDEYYFRYDLKQRGVITD